MSKIRNYASVQRVAANIEELKKSYDQLYTEDWLGKHRNDTQIQMMVDLVKAGPGLFLDVACGLGFAMEEAEARGAKAVGLDISFMALKKSEEVKPGLKVVQGNGEQLPWADETFDYVICTGSLEHFLNPELGVREISRVLKSTGRSAILLPNSHNLLAIYNVYKTGGILPEQQDFERFATRLEWQTMLESNGLQVESVHKFNVGFARAFKKGREGFWYIYNSIYRVFGERWIPLNLSYNLVFICRKAHDGSE
jgi:ubiquinone/menaquinone biosynthesis C-methylase UbiE